MVVVVIVFYMYCLVDKVLFCIVIDDGIGVVGG